MVSLRGFRWAATLVGLMAPLLAAGASVNQKSDTAPAERSVANHKSYWSSRIAAPEPGDNPEASLTLKRLIRKVQAVTLDEKSPASPPAPPEPAGDTGTQDTGPKTGDTSQRTEEPRQRTEDRGQRPEDSTVLREQSSVLRAPAPETATTVSPKARRLLEDLRQNPGRVQDPLDMAELLFLSGRPRDAAAFYEEALRRAGAEDAAAGDTCAWILFQLGNCLRQTDPAKAQEAYTKLIATYPTSPWTEMARAGGRLLTWYQSARPDQLMAPIQH